jgi:hypothetical protein
MTFKAVKYGDPVFTMIDDNGITICNRAGLEYSGNCPNSLILKVQEAIVNGWITPVAYMREKEYTWESLKE